MIVPPNMVICNNRFWTIPIIPQDGLYNPAFGSTLAHGTYAPKGRKGDARTARTYGLFKHQQPLIRDYHCIPWYSHDTPITFYICLYHILVVKPLNYKHYGLVKSSWNHHRLDHHRLLLALEILCIDPAIHWLCQTCSPCVDVVRALEAADWSMVWFHPFLNTSLLIDEPTGDMTVETPYFKEIKTLADFWEE